jgi:hypothetical protein
MASEIERLPDLAGFLKLATTPDWQFVRLTPRNEPVAVRVRKPSVAASPPATAAPTPPPSSPTPPPAPASRRVSPRGGQARAGAPKRPRKQKATPQQAPSASGDKAAESVTLPPQITVPDTVNGPVQKLAGRGESKQQPL